MSIESKLDRHTDLFHRMTDALGVDVETRTHLGMFSPEEEAEAIHRCMGCTDPSACKARLDAMAPLSEPPAYCRNRDDLLQMQAEGI